MNKKGDFELGQIAMPIMVSFVVYLILTGVLIYLGDNYMDKYYDKNEKLETLLAAEYITKSCFASDTNAHVIDVDKFTQANLDICLKDDKHKVTIKLHNLQTYEDITLQENNGAATTYTYPTAIWNKQENKLQQGIINVGYDEK